jgi:putative tRNA adenosine deaminase-associated protein
MSHFACALVRSGRRWQVREIDLDGSETIDDVLDELRDLDGSVRVLAIEEDDEYAALVRLDGDEENADDAPRVFLSNGRAAGEYPMAALLAEGLDEIGGDPLSEDEDAPAAFDAAPFGDADLLEDLGVRAAELVELAQHESTLPIDLLVAVCERLGCVDAFDAVRG